MGYTCCVPNCRTGYRPRKGDAKDENSGVRMFVFPQEQHLRQKWIESIPRNDWTVTEYTRVCANHFSPSDLREDTCDTNSSRRKKREISKLSRLRLKPGVVPHIFPGSSSSKTKSTKSGALARLSKEKPKVASFETIETLDSLKEKIGSETLPSGYTTVCTNDSLQFHFIETLENMTNPPKLAISVVITQNLEVFAFVNSKPVPRLVYEDVLPSGFVQSTSEVANVLAVCTEFYDGGDDTSRINLAVSLLEDYLVTGTESTAVEDDHSMPLLGFIVEQLKLIQTQPEERWFSPDTLMLAFLWRLTSPGLYKNLKRFFVLPTMSRLRQISPKMTVEPRTMDLDYLRVRSKDLTPRNRVVSLMIHIVYTAQKIEYTNGSFAGLTEEGRPAKTVLAFTVQSLFSKYKDLVCMIPVEKLNTNILRNWFEFVMESLDEFFLVIAVSTENHVCSRKLFIELCGGELRPSIQHPIRSGEELFLIFDFTHNLKEIYHDFVNKKQMNPPTAGYENILGASCDAKFSHVTKLYELQESRPVNSAHQLTKVSLNQTSPKHALAVFSEGTVVGLKSCGHKGSSFRSTQFIQTARYVEFVQNVWNIMSVKSTNRITRERNPFFMPLQERVGVVHPGEEYLKEAIAIFREWEKSDRAGLTNETFMACIQTMTAVLSLSKYLQHRHGAKYFLTGKVMSDPIEARSGMYRHSNGANFFMSVKQLLLAEKTLGCLSLLQQHGLKSILRLNVQDPSLITGVLQSQDDYEWLVNFLSPYSTLFNFITTKEASVIYFVSGYIGRSISEQQKCMDCKKLLISDRDVPDLESCFPEEYRRIFGKAGQGGLAEPTELCFAITALAIKYYTIISDSSNMRKKLFNCQDQRCVFSKATHEVVHSSSLMRPILNACCGSGHANFDFIVQMTFNCFAKYDIKRFNSKRSVVEPPAKTCKIRKFTTSASKD